MIYIFLDISVLPYFIGKKGGSCEDGTLILTKQDCKIACDMLNIATGAMRNMRNNSPCYLAGNGKCRQDGGQSTKTSPICRKNGNTADNKLKYCCSKIFSSLNYSSIVRS